MQKINFQNLPNTTTPVNSTNLNALQDNVEDVFNGDETMGVIKPQSINSYEGRLNTPDFAHQYPHNKISKRLDIVSSSMDGSSRPNKDGYLETFFWDNSGEYDTQLFIPNSFDDLQFRAKSNGWNNNWRRIPVIEEGTWTPVMQYANVTYTRQTGSYKKLGKIVFFNCRLRGTINSVSGDRYARIFGLPYTPNDSFSASIFEHYNCCDNGHSIIVMVAPEGNNNMISLQNQTNSAGASVERWVAGQGTFYISISGFYFID